MIEKKFKVPKNEIIRTEGPRGGCIASDKITVDGLLVGYMYREEGDFSADSGWRFFSGTEEDAYMDNSENFMFYNISTIVNYDPAILPYLHLGIGAELERNSDNTFNIIKH